MICIGSELKCSYELVIIQYQSPELCVVENNSDSASNDVVHTDEPHTRAVSVSDRKHRDLRRAVLHQLERCEALRAGARGRSTDRGLSAQSDKKWIPAFINGECVPIRLGCTHIDANEFAAPEHRVCASFSNQLFSLCAVFLLHAALAPPGRPDTHSFSFPTVPHLKFSRCLQVSAQGQPMRARVGARAA